MTDQMMSHTASPGKFKAASFLRRIGRNWRARGAVAKLDFLSDELLRDIGLNRSDLRWALQLPLTINAEIVLKDRVCRPGGTPDRSQAGQTAGEAVIPAVRLAAAPPTSARNLPGA